MSPRWGYAVAAWSRRHQLARLADWSVVAAVVVTTALPDTRTADEFAYLTWEPPLWLVASVTVVVGAGALRRRGSPVLFLGTALVCYVTVTSYVPVVFAQYAVGAYLGSYRRATGATVATLLVVGLPIWRFGGGDAATPISIVMCVLPVVVGGYVRTRRQLIDNIRDRAEHAEREQHERVERARNEERAQIARDMHDVVTHRVSLMVLHATALEAAEGRDATEFARKIGAIGREALDELRALVEVLRSDGDPPLAPHPGLADLDELTSASRALGMPVTLDLTGVAGTKVPSLAQHTAYRVVQEALTNVHKHAGDAPTTVEVRHLPEELRVTVTNEVTRETVPRLPAGGHGLVGIAERVRLVGGELTAKVVTDGGFQVAATIPLGTDLTP